MSTILIASAAAALIAVPVVWYLVNRSKEVKEPTEEPKDPEPAEDPVVEPTEDPIEEPTEPVEEPVEPAEEPQEPEEQNEKPIEEPINTEPTAEQKLMAIFNKLMDYFCVPKDSKTESYLWHIFLSIQTHSYLFDKDNFPVVYDYWGDKEHENSAEILCAWLFAMVLTEIIPEQRQQLYKAAYNYCNKGKDEPIYGWDFLSDPNVIRQMASVIYAVTRKEEVIPELRGEM